MNGTRTECPICDCKIYMVIFEDEMRKQSMCIVCNAIINEYVDAETYELQARQLLLELEKPCED